MDLTVLPSGVCRRYTDEEARNARMIENLLREDLEPLEEAEGYQQMFVAAAAENRTLTPADIAAKIGKPESYVRLRLRLLSSIAEVQDALRKQRITVSHAVELARLDKSVQKDLLKFCLFERWGEKRAECVSLSELRRHIASHVMLGLAEAPFDTKNPLLIPEAGACVDCSKRTGNATMLFSNVKQGDVCTHRPCFEAKVTRHLDVTVEQLMASNKPVVRISDSYSRGSNMPADVLPNSQYNVVKKGKSCEHSKIGV